MKVRPCADAVAQANAAAKQPVLFIQDLRLGPEIWDPWVTVFERAGYVTLAPLLSAGADRDSNTDVAEPVEEAVGRFRDIIQALSSRPAIVGVAWGGLVAFRLAEAGLSAATIVIFPVPDPTGSNMRNAAELQTPWLTIALDHDSVPTRERPEPAAEAGWLASVETALSFIQRFV